MSEADLWAMHAYAQRGIDAAGYLILVSANRQDIIILQWIAHAVFVRTEMHRRPQFQPGAVLTRVQTIGDVSGILAVNEKDSLLEHESLCLKSPRWQPVLEPELV